MINSGWGCDGGGGFGGVVVVVLLCVVVLVLVWWWWWVGTEPGFKKEENVLRWNVHQLHFLWAGEWGYGPL